MEYSTMQQRIRELSRSELLHAYVSLKRYVWPGELGQQPRWWKLKRSCRAPVWRKYGALLDQIKIEMGERALRQIELDCEAGGFERQR